MIEYTVDGHVRRAPLWVPSGFDLHRRYPDIGWVVFLHAYEERGDHDEHLQVGLAPVLEELPELYRVPVLFPQCPPGHVWSAAAEPWHRSEPTAEHHIDAAVTSAERFPALSAGRAVLTGASMGGFATLLYGSRRASRFRGFHSVCGGGDPAKLGDLSRRPVWLHHAVDDDVVPVASSRRMFARLNDASPNRVRSTEYADGGHACWERAYRDPLVAEFLATATLDPVATEGP